MNSGRLSLRHMHNWVALRNPSALVQCLGLITEIHQSQREYISSWIQPNTTNSHIIIAQRSVKTFNNALCDVGHNRCLARDYHFTHNGYHDRFSHIDPKHLWHILHWSTQVCGVSHSERLCLHTLRALMFPEKINANHNWSFDFCHQHHVWPNVLASAKLQIQLHCA